jgi:hypothetical protein
MPRQHSLDLLHQRCDAQRKWQTHDRRIGKVKFFFEHRWRRVHAYL